MKVRISYFRTKRIISIGFEPFEWFIKGVIFLSVVFAAIEFMSAESYLPFIYIQWLFLGIFISEMVIKYIAFGKELFKGWNLFDLLLVVMIIVCEILFVYGSLAVILRFSRIISRFLRLLLPKSLPNDLLKNIESGEGKYLEFKSTMRWSLKENKVDKKIEEAIIKTISAFSNSEGGKLLIGVADKGEVLGLKPDYETLKEANKDQFELHLINIMNNTFGKEFTKDFLVVRFPVVKDKEICEIDIKEANIPLFCKFVEKNGLQQKKFYVRSGNSSQELDIEEAAAYIKKRF